MPRRRYRSARSRPDPTGAVAAVAFLLLSGVFTPTGRAILVVLVPLLILLALAVVLLVRRNRRRPTPWIPSGTLDTPVNIANGVTLLPARLSPGRAPGSPTGADDGQSLRALDWYQFEKLVAEAYAGHGYTVERLGGARPDGGVDLLAREPEALGARTLVVQCKHWSAYEVREREVRELLGSLVDRPGGVGVLVTLRGFTEPARRLAARHAVQLLGEAEVMALVEGARLRGESATAARLGVLLSGADRRCPKCEAPMVERTAGRGSRAGERFWGCSTYPRCRGTFQVRVADTDSAPLVAAPR